MEILLPLLAFFGLAVWVDRRRHHGREDDGAHRGDQRFPHHAADAFGTAGWVGGIGGGVGGDGGGGQ